VFPEEGWECAHSVFVDSAPFSMTSTLSIPDTGLQFRAKLKSEARGVMSTAFMDHYRCPESFADVQVKRPLSEDVGYFRCGADTICYGRSASGSRATRARGVLYDVSEDVTTRDATTFLPFDPTDVIDNLRLERYAKHYSHSAFNLWKRSLRNAYYFLRPMMHLHIRKQVQRAHLNGWRNLPFPHWPVDTTVENLCEGLLMLSMKAQEVDRVPFVWFWPDGSQACITLTHDVEAEAGKNFCNQLMDIDDSFGVKAAFQLVPEERYECSAALIESIRSRGFEVNIQDLNHDGHLYRNRGEFLRRAQKINQYARAFGSVGFRAATLYRNLDWYDALQFSFDMSVPNVAHLDPQRGGCCTVMPYFIGHMLEIPLTTTQDYMLFYLLNDYSLDLWKTQTQLILEKNGLISFIVHPDYIIEQKARAVYRDLLAYLRQLGTEKNLWFVLPGEIDRWWRARQMMTVVKRDGNWQVEGSGAERAKVAFATIVGDHLEYEIQNN